MKTPPSNAPGLHTSPPPAPTMYCRRCEYVLDGLTDPRCPECGRVFDPAQRRSYRSRPRPRRRVRTLLKLTAGAVVALIVVWCILYGWLTRQAGIGQRDIAKLRALNARYSTGPLLPGELAIWAAEFRLPQPNVLVKLTLREAGDADLEALHGVNYLRELTLSGGNATDAGFTHLRNMRSLLRLRLDDVSITDDGLANLSRLNRLKSLSLGDVKITDAGLAHLSGLDQLEYLGFGNVNITGAGFRHFEQMTNLEQLSLWAIPVTDASLAHLKPLSNLRYLGLVSTQITDDGLIHLP